MTNDKITTPGPHTTFRRSELTLPAGACDSHVHIFGPHKTFPFDPDRTFTPEDAGVDMLRRMHRTMGFDRAVLVQSAAHGRDYRVLFDALRRGDGAYRAVALLEPGTPDEEIALLDSAGFCGTRVHFAPHLGTPPSLKDIQDLCERIRPYGWHLEVHTMGDGLWRFAEMLPHLSTRIVLDHVGRFDISEGANAEGLSLLKELLRNDDFWVKLSGVDRISSDVPSMRDGLEIARAVFSARPDRCVWGSDFPHPNTNGFMPWDHELVNAISSIAPTEEERTQLLVANPTACFDFKN